MEIEVRRLTPELAEDYVRFFDLTPHDDNVDEHKCYCVCWCGDDAEGKDFSTREKRREYALEYVKQGKLQGYLAYQGERIVGWCNANTKAECLRCASWRRFMGNVPVEEPGDARVKSVFCFVIAPDLRRQGLARLLLERVCHDAAEEGFAYVEAYPWKELDFGGYYEMYQQSGFSVFLETEHGYVVRRPLG